MEDIKGIEKVNFGDIGRVIYDLERANNFYIEIHSDIFLSYLLDKRHFSSLGKNDINATFYWIKSFVKDRGRWDKEFYKQNREAIFKIIENSEEFLDNFDEYDSIMDHKKDDEIIVKPIIPFFDDGRWCKYIEDLIKTDEEIIAYIFSPMFKEYNVQISKKASLFAKIKIETFYDLPRIEFKPLEPLFSNKSSIGRCDPQSPCVIPESFIDYLTLHKDYKNLWLSFVNPFWKHHDSYINGIEEVIKSKLK